MPIFYSLRLALTLLLEKKGMLVAYAYEEELHLRPN
jgi:hypothetical protein